MSKTRGYAALSPRAALAPYSFERRDPRENDVVIDIKYCGICHSDIHQTRDEWSEYQEEAIFPMVPGHEIAGIVSAVGNKVTRYKMGDKVGVGCFVDSCRNCAECRQGLEQYCTVGTIWTYNGRGQEGNPTYGGYSERIVVDEHYVLRLPENLPLDACAPLLCAGITLYSPLRHWGAGPGKKVAIVGLGGLGHMGVKLAHSFGAETVLFTTSPSKIEDGKRLGADEVVVSRDDAQMQKHQRSFDLIVNTVAASHNLDPFFNLLKRDGTLVLV